MLSVIKHAVGTFFFHQHSASVSNAWCLQYSSVSAVENHFFDSYGPSSPEMNSNDYSTRFMESYGIMDMSCKSATLKKSSSNWLNSGKPLTQHLKCTISAFPCFPR